MEKAYKIEIFSKKMSDFPERIHAAIEDILTEAVGNNNFISEPPFFCMDGAFYTATEEIAKNIVETINKYQQFCAKYTSSQNNDNKEAD